MASAAPEQPPTVRWSVPLQAAITGRPALMQAPDAWATAYVGSHTGRVVGVTAEGPHAGAIVLDVTFDGIVWGSAAVDGDRLYVGADDDVLYAIDLRTQQVSWRQRLGRCDPPRAAGPHGARCDVDGGPTVLPEGDLLVGADGVYRIGADGEVRWHWPSSLVPQAHHVFSTPAWSRQVGIVFGNQAGAVVALTEDGASKWTFPVGADVDGTPAIGPDGRVYVGADDGLLRAFGPSGTLLWTAQTEAGIRTAVALAPDGALYVTSLDGGLYRFSEEGDLQWRFATGDAIASSPVVDGEGRILFGSRDDHVYLVDADGRMRWAVELPSDVDSTPALTGRGTIVVGCDDGLLRGLE